MASTWRLNGHKKVCTGTKSLASGKLQVVACGDSLAGVAVGGTG